MSARRPARAARMAALLLALAAHDGSCAEPGCEKDGRFQAGTARIEASFDERDYALPSRDICAWLTRATDAVARYYGRFPVAALKVVLKPGDGGGVSGGMTFGHSDYGMPLIRIRLGRKAGREALAEDWVMTHELVHLSVPEVPDNSHWLEEGIATYVEPVARVQAGQLAAARIWGDMHADMWKGTPAAGDRGLDRTPTWGRTYWGGALFCLLADVDIRARTGNKKGLQDALRGVIAAGGSIEQDWSVERFVAAGDKATGVPVLSELYARMKDAPGPDDAELEALWKKLGVVGAGGREVKFHDAAPLAAIRRAITAQPPN